MDLDFLSDAGADAGQDLFVPVVAPEVPLTPGLSHAFGAGRRIQRGPDGLSWEPYAFSELEQAVEDVFAAQPTSDSTAELIRPYIEHLGGDSVWAGVGVVPPPTPVAGTRLPAVVGNDALDLESPLPTRRELRERRRAEESARTQARNRLAKGGVLALAMFGAVATQLPQALHGRIFGETDGGNAVAALALAAPSAAVDTSAMPRDGVEQTLKQQMIKKDQVQRVSAAAQDAGAVLVAVAKAQAASDEAARRAAVERAAREAQRNPKALARIMVADRGWSNSQFACLDLLWTRESNWSYRAANPSSGAYGIPQALPGSKMASAGSDWRVNPATQMEWGLDYIADRYGTPCSAWSHSESHNWY